MRSGSPILSAEYVKKTWTGEWRWVFGGSHSGSYMESGYPVSYQYLPVVAEKRYRVPYPVIYGGIFDPDITRLAVKDDQSGLERQAKIIPVDDRLRLYVVKLTEPQGTKFDLIAYNGKNEMVHAETIDGSAQSSGSAGTKRVELE